MRRAILIAASQFEEAAFAPLQFPVRDAESLRDLLADDQMGGFEEVELIANQPSRVARIALEMTARSCEPDDLLLFYFSGHGKLDRDGSLALIMPDSDTRVLSSTSLVSDEIKRIFNMSRAARKVIILDCCYSGAAGVEGFKSSLSDTIDTMAQNFRGSFLLTASQRFERAWENETKGAGALTHALIDGVKSGAAGKSASDHITLAEIASYVKRSVPNDSPQLPEYWDNGIGDLIFSRKPPSFDAEWSRKVRAWLTRNVSNGVFEEDLADAMREVVRKRDNPGFASQIALLDQAAKRQLPINKFLDLWRESKLEPAAGKDSSSSFPQSEEIGGERVSSTFEPPVESHAASATVPEQHPPVKLTEPPAISRPVDEVIAEFDSVLSRSSHGPTDGPPDSAEPGIRPSALGVRALMIGVAGFVTIVLFWAIFMQGEPAPPNTYDSYYSDDVALNAADVALNAAAPDYGTENIGYTTTNTTDTGTTTTNTTDPMDTTTNAAW